MFCPWNFPTKNTLIIPIKICFFKKTKNRKRLNETTPEAASKVQALGVAGEAEGFDTPLRFVVLVKGVVVQVKL